MVDLTELDGVAEGRAENLQEAGYESVEDLVDADPEEIAEEVNYLPEDTALNLIVQSQNLIAEEEAEVEEDEPTSVTEEVADAVEEEPEVEEEEETVEEDTEDSDEEEEETIEEDSEDGPIAFELTFEEALAYDTFFDAVMGQRSSMLQSNRDGVDVFDHALDQMRQSAGADATVELEMTEAQLNDLHNSVRQTMIAYKGDNLIDHMDALQRVLSDINDVRDEHLF
jgi:hypothetical protein